MRILIIGETQSYEELIRSTPTGHQCQITFLDYQEVLDINQAASVVFVEANIGNQQGLNAGRMILQRFPGTTLIFLMKECQFEYSMLAMRMGARNILVGEEINVYALEQMLQQHISWETADQKESISRNFERMIFLHNEGAERLWSTQALNRAFETQRGQKQFFVLLATSLEFVRNYHRSETVMKKVHSEKIKQRLLQIGDKQITIPFVFYIDQLFYVVAVCEKEGMPETPQMQIQYLQQRIYTQSREVLGDNQILLCSRSRTDFGSFRECLTELDMLMEGMHCSDLPGMLSVYNIHRTRRDWEDVTSLLELASSSVETMEAGGEYEEQFKELFSPAIMERITFDQFMKVKEHIAFALMSVYRKCESGIEDRQMLMLELDRLQMICTYPYALKQILSICKQLACCCGRRYHPLVAQCINLISQRYMTEISQQEIADALNISNVYLSTLFRKETGQKFSTYVNDYRLTKASELIDRGEYPLSRIYEMVGFTNQQYFSNCFRKKFAMTPTEYKHRNRKN